jgi:predicted O-methyltransferase YrrM
VDLVSGAEMSQFEEIVKFEDGPVQYENTGSGHIKMKQHPYPYSIKEEEFNFLRDLIIEHNLQRGYECATAFGVSSCAIGLGFKQTGGKVVTMDAYIEEKCQNPGAYKDFERTVYETSDGYKSVKYLIEKFELQDTLFPEIGWSPDNTFRCIKNHFREKLDFVFIDAGHFEDQMIKDIDAFLPLLADKYVLAFHDVYEWSFSNKVHDHLMNTTGKKVEIMIPSGRGENLGVIINI